MIISKNNETQNALILPPNMHYIPSCEYGLAVSIAIALLVVVLQENMCYKLFSMALPAPPAEDSWMWSDAQLRGPS